ncbi:MAG: C13 family peptidase [Promethearchaeota archaeon]
MIVLTTFAVILPNAQIIGTDNNESLQSTEIKPKSAAARLTIGAWIIIAGDRESDHACVEQIKRGSDSAYFILASRDVSTSNIKYLGPDWVTQTTYYSSLQEDVATLENIEWAITEWADTRVGPGQALGLYLFDHGSTNGMAIPGPNLADSDLNDWLDELEASSGCNRMIIIYEACHAGSFIDPISKHNRIVITSTSSGGSAWPSTYWAYFSEEFFSSIVACKTIGECFEDAVAYVKAVGVGDTQYPMIDDNHDDTGHQVDAWGTLPNGGDGSDALNYWIGDGSNCPETLIQWLPLKAFASVQTPITPIWAVVKNSSKIEKVYVRVIPPDWVPPPPPQPDDDGIRMIPDGILPQYLNDTDGDGNYTGNIDIGRDLGDYKITFHANSEDGSVADIESTYVTLNQDGTRPPDTTPPSISITNPKENAGLKGIVNITAEGDDDQALDKIQLYFDGALVKEEPMPPCYPYPEVVYSLDTADYSFGLHNITAIAIDKANYSQETSILVTIERDQIPGFEITTLFTGTLIGIIIVFTIYIKNSIVKKNQEKN